MYLTFEEYQEMGGALDEGVYNNYEFKAESIINWYTFNRLANDTVYPEAVKKCMFALISILVNQDNALNAVGDLEDGSGSAQSIASQSNDGVSVSYNVLGASDAYKLCGSEIDGLIKRSLQYVTNELGRRLLYRGLYPGE